MMDTTERKQAEGDLAYWQELADATGWRVLGFTFRSGATFISGGETIPLSSYARDEIMASIAAGRTAERERIRGGMVREVGRIGWSRVGPNGLAAILDAQDEGQPWLGPEYAAKARP